jgi:hypothetical protein
MSISRFLAEIKKKIVTNFDGGEDLIASSETVKVLNEKFKVLQVVQGTTSTSVNIASTSYTDTGITATITPTLTSSKILVIVSATVVSQRETNATRGNFINLVRSSTQIFERKTFEHGALGASLYIEESIDGSFAKIDSPNTTASVTYKVQGKVSTSDNNTLLIFQRDGSDSTITLIEIAG